MLKECTFRLADRESETVPDQSGKTSDVVNESNNSIERKPGCQAGKTYMTATPITNIVKISVLIFSL